MKIRTRFAPSPTGDLHLGSGRTALFNWLFARKYQGDFILRIEDTDIVRSSSQSALEIIESLKWLGLDWDEGPYYQSSRFALYKEHIDRLKASGHIYPAFEKKEALDDMRKRALDEKRSVIYDRSALKLSSSEIKTLMEQGEPFVWRFKVNEGFTDVPELLMANAHYQVDNATIGDFVLTRPGTLDEPGAPLYNFACAIDDALMGITHVFRGVEHLQNTAKQILICHALNYKTPKYIHSPLILKNGKKMSKRDVESQKIFPVSVLGRRDEGYPSEATINYLALLGWAPRDGTEIFSLEKLKNEFDIDRLGKVNANFDEDKYLFLNSQYIKNAELPSLRNKLMPFLSKADERYKKLDVSTLDKLISIGQDRCKLLSEFHKEVSFFLDAPKYYNEEDAEETFENRTSVEILNKVKEDLMALSSLGVDSVGIFLKKLSSQLQLPMSKIGSVIRLALTGKRSSPPLALLFNILGKDEACLRIQAAINFIELKLSKT